jgi:CheY-like chemotaxis protein
MVRSGRFYASTLPVVVVYNDFTIPPSLANEHNISTLSLDDVECLSEVAKASLQGSPKPCILIIEDDSNAANLARLALKKNYTVEVAPDGDSGVVAWKAHHHDLVLLDVMLPWALRATGVATDSLHKSRPTRCHPHSLWHYGSSSGIDAGWRERIPFKAFCYR